MPRYRFRARNLRGKPVSGVLVAATESDARQQLVERKYQVDSVAELRGLLTRIDYALAAMKPANLFELAITTRQLSTMLNAGVGIVRAMQVLTEQPLSSKVYTAWSEVRKDINQGHALSRAMGKQHVVFETLYVGMVKAGETTGQITQALTYLADHLDKELNLRRKVQAAMTYPALIFTVCVGLCVLFVQHILPQFINGLFRNSGMQLPFVTRALIAITDLFNDPRAWGTALAAFLVGGWLLANYLATPAGRHRWQQLALRLPLVRDVTGKVLAARFCRTMGTLVGCGIPIVHSLELTGTALGNFVLAEYLENAKGILKDGGKLSDGLRAIPFFPPMLASFVDLGETTGRIAPLMAKLAEIYDQELDLALETFTRLLEPMMVMVMGCVVAFVLLAIFVPLYQILGTF